MFNSLFLIYFFADFLKGLLPFFEKIPEREHSEYIEECAQWVIYLSIDATKTTAYYNRRKMCAPYRNLIAYVQK